MSQTTLEPASAGVAGSGGPVGSGGSFDWRRYAIYLGFVVVFLLFALFLGRDGFLTSTNLLNIFRQTAIISIMAVAMTFVIASAQIDLSVGSVAGLGVGLVVGVINGGLVTFLGMPSFLVTLAMLGIAVGLAQLITSSAPEPILNGTFNTIFGGGNIGPIPGLLVWTVVVVVIGAVVLAKTRYGRQVLATGGNRTAAKYSGVNTKRITFTVLLVSALVASVAGMLYAGRLESGRYQLGDGDELSVIAAVILGGTSLFGGAGSVIGALFGSLLIGLINNGLILAGLDSSQQQIIRGLIIIVAVALARKK